MRIDEIRAIQHFTNCLKRELLAHKSEANTRSAPEPLVLLPLEVMVKPLELGFKYHFDGDRPTNRPDKVNGGKTSDYCWSNVYSPNTFSQTFSEFLIHMTAFLPDTYSLYSMSNLLNGLFC